MITDLGAQKNTDLDFWAEAIGEKRRGGECDDDLSDRLKAAFGFSEECFRVCVKPSDIQTAVDSGQLVSGAIVKTEFSSDGTVKQEVAVTPPDAINFIALDVEAKREK